MRKLDLYKIKGFVKGIEPDNSSSVRKELLAIEGPESNPYIEQVFLMFHKDGRVENRSGSKAYDGLINIFNLAYAVSKWKVHGVILKVKLEPYLGFLHSEKFGEPFQACGFMELYRYLIEYDRNLSKRDFTVKKDSSSMNKKGKKAYLNDSLASDLSHRLNVSFEYKVMSKNYAW